MDLFELIGPVMVGPSSSHTAGAARIGLTARMLLGERVTYADVRFHGSFAKTYHGHGTDRAIVGGLMGMAVDDLRLRDSLEIAKEQGLTVDFRPVTIRGAHPNTVRLDLTGVTGRRLTMEAASVGGGEIEITRLDGLRVGFSGMENTLIVHHTDMPGVIARVTGAIAKLGINIAGMQVFRREAGAEAIMVLELDSALEDGQMESIESIDHVQRCTFLKRRTA